MEERYTGDDGNGHWEFIEVFFDAANYDFTNVDYVAVQIRADKGNPGLTAGVLQGGNRLTSISGTDKKYYFLSEAGALTELPITYDAVNFGVGACGTLLMPIANMSWQWGTGDLTKIASFYLTANTLYNWDWSLTIGEIGVYVGEPDDPAATFTKLVDLSGGERAKSKYNVDSVNQYCMEMPSDRDRVTPVLSSYPYRRGSLAFANSVTWKGVAAADSNENWQTLTVKFDTPTIDLTNATYLVVQYRADAGTPGITFGLQAGDARYSTNVDGKPVYFVNEGGTKCKAIADVTYGAVNVAQGSRGALLIPMSSMAWKGGTQAEQDLSKIESLILTTNSQYNYNYKLTVGEVGFYSGEPGTKGSSFARELELTTNKSGKYSVNSTIEANRSELEVNRAVVQKMGDATMDFTAEGKSAEDFSIWTGGSFGTVEMTKDTYQQDAIKITATDNNPDGDAYVAVTLTDPAGFSWGGMQGISFWARNDSDTEISFNIEIDCRADVTKAGVKDLLKDRFNIKQGNRYYLYDVNTGKTTIYMTRPTATLPVGFEGWVRIPFTAFNRADWSNNGVTKDSFMNVGSTVEYLAITVHAATYRNKPFSINAFGGYAETPSFVSAFVGAEGRSIPELMGLIAEVN